MEYTAGAIDPQRPWIRDERDAPATMNWRNTLFNPFGKTYKLHFTRAWTFMFMGRLLLYVVPSFIAFLAGIAGVGTEGLNAPVNLVLFSVPAVLLPFALFTLITEYTSFVVHVRRLTEAGRSAFMAVIVLVPMLLGLIAYALGTQAGAAQYRQMHSPANTEVVEAKSEKKGEEEEGEEAASGDPKAAPAGGRGGARNPQMARMMELSERELAQQTGMGMAFPIWWLASFGAMLWSLIYVARLPNGGEGKFRTGSHMTPEEIARGV
ncbi:MAG: hypothetical protein B7X53_13245 [Hyphomonas sp. 34-62-18]|nr:hypothetical protein [Hyphomonas sp. 34-62-18]OZB14714.1 MAG: hypothetical protein B7X53_13245 [Hyphomonas sp. 34-62-18]